MISVSVRGATLALLLVASAGHAQLQLPDLLGGQERGQSGEGALGGLGGGLGGGSGALGGLLGAVLPDVASVGANNAAGVLGYCLKNKYLGANGAASVLGRLTGRPGTKASPAYAAGQKGLLQMNGSSLPLGNLKSQVTTKVCDLVLKRAQSLL
ncbi:MAG TPA: DUF2501 domain-containing protein [Sphingobium sp.]